MVHTVVIKLLKRVGKAPGELSGALRSAPPPVGSVNLWNIWGYGIASPIMENPMEKESEIENEIATRIVLGTFHV